MSDYAAVQAADPLTDEYPDGWPSQVGKGDKDVIEGWSVLPCVLPDPVDPLGPPLATCLVVTLPLSFDDGASDVPVVCAVPSDG